MLPKAKDHSCFPLLLVLCTAFNEDGLHVDSGFTKKCVMFSNSSVTTHSGSHPDTGTFPKKPFWHATFRTCQVKVVRKVAAH